MPDGRSGAAGPEGGRVKVNDRRRFSADGEPIAPDDVDLRRQVQRK